VINRATADAYAGHRDEALRGAAQAAGLVQTGDIADAFTVQYALAYIQLLLGNRQAAADALVAAIHMPGLVISIPMVRADPTWTWIHSIPAYQRLIAEGRPIA
jgi:hypothetical protein